MRYALTPPERDYKKGRCKEMQAVIVTGGKQYNVKEGDVIECFVMEQVNP